MPGWFGFLRESGSRIWVARVWFFSVWSVGGRWRAARAHRRSRPRRRSDAARGAAPSPSRRPGPAPGGRRRRWARGTTGRPRPRPRRGARRAVERRERRDVPALDVGLAPGGLGLRDRLPACRHLLGAGRRPERMPVGHGDAPLRHRAVRLACRDLREDPPRLVVEEGVEQRRGVLDVLLGAGPQERREVDRAPARRSPSLALGRRACAATARGAPAQKTKLP